MASMNINAGASGNPLDALLAQNKGSLWGNLGGLLYGRYNITTNGGLDEGGNPTPVPDGMVTENDDRYQGAIRDLNGRTQLRNTNVGGPGGVIDPSKVTYDPRYGLVTDPSNLNPVGETFLDKYGPWLLMAAAGAGIAAQGAGLIGSGAEAGAGAAGTAGAGTAGVGDAGLTGVGSNVGDLGAAGGAAGASGGSSGGLLSGLGDQASGLLGQAGSWAAAHPLQAAGLLQTAYGLVNKPSTPGGSSSSGSKGGSGGTPQNFSLPKQQFYVNPYIQAQIQRGYGQ